MSSDVRMEPAETIKWQPAPDRLAPPITPTGDLYVIGHLGIAHVPPESWRLRVHGREFPLDELRALPAVTVHAVLECFGNPLLPDEPVRRAGNVVWRGVPVATVLDLAGAPVGQLLWAEGADSGVFDGTPCAEYLKDLPLDVVRDRGVLVYEMNGEPLTAEHGFPARLFVPGYFGTNNVKWLRSLTVADHRPEHLFTTTLYQRVPPGGGAPEPVRDLDVTSLVTGVHRDGPAVTVTGWAWSSSPVVGVEVGLGERWVEAELSAPVGGPYGWRGFTTTVVPGRGDDLVVVRARDGAGRRQPLAGARNACHAVPLPI